MSDEENLEEEEKNQTESLEEVPVDDDDELDLIEDDDDEVDQVAAVEEEEQEKGAILVVGQGDMEMCESNRGAEDPGDNTLCEPQFIEKYGEMLFIADRGNNRVMVWDQIPEESGEPASVVLGQDDFSDCLENRGITTTLDEMTSGLGDEDLDGFTISQAEEDTMSQPAGLAVIDGKLYVSDSGNHRVSRWDSLPSEDGEAPTMVLGQDNLEGCEANRRGLIGSGSLFFPFGICSGNDQHVFVADKDNHRVLIWAKIPFNDGWNADVTLGQTGMDEREPNRGDYEYAGPDTLSFPTGVFYHLESDKFFVVDQGNNRVLIWNKLPNSTGQPADLVLGQKDFISREVNRGYGFSRAADNGMHFPTDVVFGKAGLFVSDSGNNRVLVWNELPTENGQPADVVLGQKNFAGNAFNRGETVTAATLNDPYGLFLDESLETDDDAEEEEENQWKLYIADRGNSRVVIWNELPTTSKKVGELPDVYGENLVYEQDELMGDDDEFMDEENAESEEEKIPLA